MTKISYTFIFMFFCVYSSVLFSQTFKDYKVTKEGKIVYFTLTGILDQEHSDEVNAVLSKDQNVSQSIIYKSKEVFLGKIFLKGNVEADYFRKILQSIQVDIDPSSLIDYSNAFDTRVSAHYPLFIDTGNPEKDKIVFENAKKIWIKIYPKEVANVSGKNYYDFVSRESFYINEKPVFIDTGNPDLDKQMFEKREQEWIKSNPAKLKK